MARTSDIANIATVTRASKAWDDNWSGVSGDPVGALTEFASGVMRSGPQGALIEPASTNQIRNPRAEGATVGDLAASGVLPQTGLASNQGDWRMNYTGGAVSVVATGTENGWPYIDIRFNGTFTGDNWLEFEDRQVISVSAGEVWTGSVGLKLVAGTVPARLSLNVDERTAGGGFGSFNTGNEVDLSGIDSTHRRYAITETIDHASVVSASMILYGKNFGGGAVDFTIRIYVPQFEMSAGATSVVLPEPSTPAAVTRAADFVSIPAGAWAADEPWTVYIEYVRRVATGLDYIFTISDAANQDYVAAYNSASSFQFFTAENGSITENKTGGALAALGDANQIAVANAENDLSISVAGEAQVTDATWMLPVNAATKLVLGANPAGGAQLNGYVRSFRYWPRRLTNDQLEALVGN